jgi:transcriptional regulator with XRE-family HTH domain
VGAQTGRKYEYQYERTARATLDLLVDGLKHVCVYCDWHDDYVIETGDPPTRYVFHQVKARKSSRGPWAFSEFFGVGKKRSRIPSTKPPPVRADAILPLMLLHHKNFGENCAGLAFVTNTGLDPTLSEFLEKIAAAENEITLPEDTQIAFRHIARAYTATSPQIAPSAADLFAYLRGLRVHTDKGHLEDTDAALLELADVVVNFSEIELLQRQAKQISREIVSRVRSKVAHSSTVVPTSDEQLRREKGIAIADLLGVLSLSALAYEQLKAGEGRDTVKTLSRLQRFCLKYKMDDYLEPICGFKAQWDIWRTIERHFLKSGDYVLLERKAREVLNAGLTIERIVAEAKDIAKQFDGITATSLAPEHIVGLIFSLAAQSEARSDT